MEELLMSSTIEKTQYKALVVANVLLYHNWKNLGRIEPATGTQRIDLEQSSNTELLLLLYGNKKLSQWKNGIESSPHDISNHLSGLKSK